MTDVVKLEPKHLDLVRQLLQENGLPDQDCHEHLEHFIGIFIGEDLVAVGGFEHLGTVGLLRSIAVKRSHRREGLATRIVIQLQKSASMLGLKAFYLLTETAEQYFLTHGYKSLSRDELPAEVAATKQCKSLCPASAQALVKQLSVDKP